MGRDKALIEVDGVPMAKRVATALARGGCEPVVFIGGAEAALRRLGPAWHADRWPGEGPLGGVVSALEAVRRDCMVAACDLADLDSASVAAVVGAASTTEADVVVARTERIEPLLAWWRSTVVDVIRARFESGERSVHRALATLNVAEVDIDAGRLRNVNSDADLAAR